MSDQDDQTNLLDELDESTEPPRPPLDNVVEFRRREQTDDAIEETLARVPPASCPHRAMLIDDTLRRVTCKACREALDPIWCLLELVKYREHLARERAWIESERAAAKRRQERAIARRTFAKQKAETAKVRENCRACNGSGWVQAVGVAGVQRCGCRTKGARLL